MPTLQFHRPNRSHMMHFGVCPKRSSKIAALPMISEVPKKWGLERTFRNQPSVAVKATNPKTNGADQGDNNNNKINNKRKVIFIMGATATGKTKISITLATCFGAEIINSDKIQAYKGLDIASNKATEAEILGVPHHLFSFIDDPNSDFTIEDFCRGVHKTIDCIIPNDRIPIIVGGSNSYVEALVADPSFKAKFDSCFLWMDVELTVLYDHVGNRVDKMLDAGLVNEIREVFDPDRKDFSRGLWRTIGVPEMAKYFKVEFNNNDGVNTINVDEDTKKILLEKAIEEIKLNTRTLVDSQLEKIYRLKKELGWNLQRIDATSVFEKIGEETMEKEWKEVVLIPCLRIVREFLEKEEDGFEMKVVTSTSNFKKANPEKNPN